MGRAVEGATSYVAAYIARRSSPPARTLSIVAWLSSVYPRSRAPLPFPSIDPHYIHLTLPAPVVAVAVRACVRCRFFFSSSARISRCIIDQSVSRFWAIRRCSAPSVCRRCRIYI